MKLFISRLCRSLGSLQAYVVFSAVVFMPHTVMAEPDLSGFPSHKNVVDIAELDKPALHQSIQDPDFGSKITRVTDISQVKGVERLRHYYAKRNPFNADESRAVFVSSDGYNWMFDTATWEPIRYLPLGSSDAEVHWHPTDKDRIFLVDFGSEYNISRMFWLNAATGEKELLLDMEQFGFITANGMMEGNPDKNMTVYAVAGNTKNKKTEIALVDINERKILARKEVDPRWVNDWISVSPSGNYVVTMGKGISHRLDVVRRWI